MLMEWHWAQVMEIMGNSLRTRYKNIIQDILLMCYWDLYMNIGYQTKNKRVVLLTVSNCKQNAKKKKKRGTKDENEKNGNREKKKSLNTSYMTICPSFCYEEKKKKKKRELRWLVWW